MTFKIMSSNAGACPEPLNYSGSYICMLIYNYPPESVGGAERQCRLQACELVKQGCKCLILTTRQIRATPRREVDQGCEVIRCSIVETYLNRVQKPMGESNSNLPPSGSAAYASLKKRLAPLSANVVRWLNAGFFMAGAAWVLYRHRREISVLHTHIADWNAGFAGWVGNRLGIPVVAKAAYLPALPPVKGVPFVALLEKWRMRIHYIALMPAMADDLCAHGIPREHIHIISNGVVVPEQRAKPEQNTTVLYVGNLTQGAAHKAFDILLQAWSKAISQKTKKKLVIAGAGDTAPWLALANHLGCEDCVQFAGFVADLSGLYRQAAMLVLPSRGEGMSNALLEAMAWGLPVIVSDIPGNLSLVVHGEHGQVVPAGDDAALSAALVALQSDPELRGRMGIAARHRIETEFSIEAVVRKLSVLYLTLKKIREK